MRIAFVCKHNVFRSRVAEAVFKKHNKNEKYKVISRGLFPLKRGLKNTIDSVKDIGYDISGKPRNFRYEEIKDQDLIIIVADDVPKELFDLYGVKTIVWKIKDIYEDNIESRKKTAREIEIKVKDFIKELE